MTAAAFTAAIKIRGINPFILVSAVRANAIKPGWRKPLPVLVRINSKPEKAWRINMMPVGNGSFYLYLHGDVRKASGTAVGDRVRVEIDFDELSKRPPASHAPMVQTGTPGESRSHEELEGARPEPQEGNPPPLLTPRVARRSCPEPQQSPPSAFRRNGTIHGAHVEGRIVGRALPPIQAIPRGPLGFSAHRSPTANRQ